MVATDCELLADLFVGDVDTPMNTVRDELLLCGELKGNVSNWFVRLIWGFTVLTISSVIFPRMSIGQLVLGSMISLTYPAPIDDEVSQGGGMQRERNEVDEEPSNKVFKS